MNMTNQRPPRANPIGCDVRQDTQLEAGARDPWSLERNRRSFLRLASIMGFGTLAMLAGMRFPFEHVTPNAYADSFVSQLSVKRADLGMMRFKGACFTIWEPNWYATSASDVALEELKKRCAANWLAIMVWWSMDSASSSTIAPRVNKSPTVDSVRHAIRKAHALGLKVMLKFHILLQDGTYVGNIKPTDWHSWFVSYRDFIETFLPLALSENVEGLILGTEFDSSCSQETEWRELIAHVRNQYAGILTYGASWWTWNGIDWYTNQPCPMFPWDAVDYIGIDAYFPLTDGADPTPDAVVAAWRSRWIPKFEAAVSRFGKPIVFPEFGYRSERGDNMHKGRSGVFDEIEQVNSYDGSLKVLREKPWFAGFFAWEWRARMDVGGTGNLDYLLNNKSGTEALVASYRLSQA